MDRHVATITTLLALLLLSCGGLRIDSRWPDRDIVIDGDDGCKVIAQDGPGELAQTGEQPVADGIGRELWY